MNNKVQKRIRRHRKIRAKISGTALVPRISVFRSNAHMMVQVIDDVARKTIAVATDVVAGASKKAQVKKDSTKLSMATKLGSELGKKIQEMGLKRVIFDRGGFKYHGRIKAFADALRSENIEF